VTGHDNRRARRRRRAQERVEFVPSRGVQAGMRLVEKPQLGATADEVIALAYHVDPQAVAADLQFFRALGVPADRTIAGMSLLQQGTTDGANLRDKVDVARSFGVRKFSFYNFGFVSETRLGWLAGL